MARKTQGKYGMSAAAQLVDMHPQTLRKYEREGLLEPARSDGYHRMYSDDDVARLAALRELAQSRGVNVAGLRVLMDVLVVIEGLERLLERSTTVNARRVRKELSRLRALVGVAT